MLKCSVTLLVLSGVLFSSAQACYKIPTKEENPEKNESVLMQINESTNFFTSRELVNWYLALTKLVYKEIAEEVLFHLYYAIEEEAIPGEHASFLRKQATEGHQAYNILVNLGKRLFEVLSVETIEKCKKDEKEIFDHIEKEARNAEHGWDKRIDYDLHYVVIALARVLEEHGCPVDWKNLGIVDKPYEQVRTI